MPLLKQNVQNFISLFIFSSSSGSASMEEVKKKRRTREKEVGKDVDDEKEASDASTLDPLAILGFDLMMKILEFLDARSVARLLVVSRCWYDIAISDRLWAPKCEELWMGKAHVPKFSKVRGASKLVAYSMSVMDGKRTRITREDLCDHVWEFHFDKNAPEYWLNLDPSWKGTGPPMRRYFHPDGSLTADPEDKVWGGHESTFTIITSYLEDGTIRNHYVRINRWPQLKISRNKDWSWKMSNNIYHYNSVPDAEKEGGTGPLFPAW